jgi:4-aminobutyrate aminotransferase-like enzyme
MLSPIVKDMAMVITEPKTSDIGYTEPVKNFPVRVSHIYRTLWGVYLVLGK